MALVPLQQDQSISMQHSLALKNTESQMTAPLALPPPPKDASTQEISAALNQTGGDREQMNATAGDKSARGYNELMDEYSLHQLMFRKGKLID